MKRVVVVGGAGYVGCVLLPKLLAAGYDVVVFDLMLYGTHGLPEHPRLEVVTGDIRDTDHYASVVQGADAVINLACI
jgi:nucleoside-diphosphate-sugar epimerase